MFVTLKTLQEDSFIVEIDPLETVRCFKEKIEKVKGETYPAKYIKLMYAGKYLIDGNRVCDYNVEEKKFVIVVVKKPRVPIIKNEDIDTSEMPPLIEISEGQNRHLCSERERLVRVIVDLGFPRSEVEQALSASFNDPDEAVELLIAGFTLSPSGSNFVRLNPVRQPRGASSADAANNLSGSRTPSPRNSLSDQDRMLGVSSNEAAESQNHSLSHDSERDDNRELMSEEDSEVRALGAPPPLIEHPQGSLASGGLSCSLMRNVLSSIGSFPDMTVNDYAAMERLTQLGFPSEKVIEAYFVCDRNEHAAADFLCSQSFE